MKHTAFFGDGEKTFADWQEHIVRRIYGADARLMPVSFTIKRPGE